MKTVINSIDKQDAINQCVRFIQYFPFRYAAVIEMKGGHFGYTTGKTMARFKRLAKEGCIVYMVSKGN